MNEQEKYMKKCFNLARKADGKTSPNPLVGAILVNKKGEIVAQGYHHKYGDNHAEVECIKNYELNNKTKNYKNLTMYVNLEPCNHYGKTPPCTDLILEKGIKKVVVAVEDPNKKHSGGIQKLKANGVEVIENVLKDDAIELNEIFFKDVCEKKVFIAIKTATTLDAKIATKTGSSKWITSEKSRKHVQKIRNKYDAILTSSITVITDNPSLTARGKNYKNPIRVILDKDLKTPVNAKVYNNDGVKILLFHSTNKIKKYPENVECIKVSLNIEKQLDLIQITKNLYSKGIKSILVEAGGTLNGSFLKEKLVDKIYHFIAPKILGDKNAKNYVEGFNATEISECKDFTISNVKYFKPDILLELRPKN